MSNDVPEIVEKMNDIYKQQKELVVKRNELLKGTDITWSFAKCRSLKCKHVKGCRNSCSARDVISYCIHDWVLPFVDLTSNNPSSKVNKETSKVPPPKSNIKTFSSLS